MADSGDETTVAEAVAALRAKGYTADFDVTPAGKIRCGACGTTHEADAAMIEVTYRFEGASDPDDEAVVFGLHCGDCGGRGVLVAAYGPSASAEEAAVIRALSH